MLSAFKDEVSRFLHPISLLLKNIGVTPNHLTLAGLLLSLLAAWAFAAGRPRTAALILLLAGLSDVMDGSMARNTGTVTRFGAFIDSVTDRYAEFFVLSGILLRLCAEGDVTHQLVLLAALIGSFMVSYARARAEGLGMECRVGLMERPERLLVLILFSLLDLVRLALWLLAVGTNFTALQRILHVRRQAG